MSFEAATYQVEQLISKKFLEIGDGYRAKNNELSSAGIPFARAANINDGFKFNDPDFFPEADLAKVGNKISKPGDVVFTSKGTVGRFALVGSNTPRFVYSPQLCFWRSLDQEKLLPEYLYYWMNSQEFLNQIGYLKGQTDMADYVSLRDQRKITATIPSTAVQQLVVAVLKPIDDRIALLRETNTTLEAIAQALFKSWFVDFDPVHAKQQGREPEGMDSTTAELFPDSFEESELGLVPSGWKLKSIGDISEILNGYAFKSEDYVTQDSAVFVLRTTNFSDDGYAKQLTKDVFLPISFLKSHSKYLCEPFDFHLVMVGASVGTTSTLLPHMLPALRNQNMWCFRPRNRFSSKFFIHEIVKLKVIEALRSTSGSAREFLRKGDFEKSLLSLPPERLLADFEDRVAVIKNKIAVNEYHADILMNIRNNLLPRLISGQLRLADTTELVTETHTET